MPVDVLGVADRVTGNAIERLTNAHHARRLDKLGRSAQHTPPDDGSLWAAGDPPPRAGNALDVLIEGVAYFPAFAQAIRCARRSVDMNRICFRRRARAHPVVFAGIIRRGVCGHGAGSAALV